MPSRKPRGYALLFGSVATLLLLGISLAWSGLAANDSCDGINVVTDLAGDAINPSGLGGSTDQVDITGVSFSTNPSKTTLTTTLKLKNLSVVPVTGSTFTTYYVIWTSSNDKTYATQVSVPDPSGSSFFWGEFDASVNQLVTYNETTGVITEGADGTVTVDVPLTGVGNPSIPIDPNDPNAKAAVTNPYALTFAGEGAFGTGLVYTEPADRAPNQDFGKRWAVCAGAPSPTPSPTPPISPIITTYAGGPGEGRALAIGQNPYAVAVRGNRVYVLDTSSYVVRAIDTASGNETVVAGNGTPGSTGDGGLATSAQINFSSYGVAVDSAGNIYIAEGNTSGVPGGGARVRKVDTSGIITTVAGNGLIEFSGDGGPATQAGLNGAIAVAVDGSGNLYIASPFNGARVRKVDAQGIITTVAGNGTPCITGSNCGDGGPATSAQFSFPDGLAVDSAGNLYICDDDAHRIRKVDGSGTITTIAGNGTPGVIGDGGPATLAQLLYPADVAVDSKGDIYISDTGSQRIRKVDGLGTITTVAGNGTSGYSGDGGAATLAQLNTPSGVESDAAGNLYIAEFNRAVRKVDAAGVITTVAGNGSISFSGDGGSALNAQINVSQGVATGADGSVYIGDTANNRVRKVDPKGVITTLAGSGPVETGGFSGDGGPAASARLSGPRGVLADSRGNVYIADSRNNRVRKVDSTGIITTTAGNGRAVFSGDGGPADVASLNFPYGLALDGDENLYIADVGNNRIRKVDRAGIITTVAGSAAARGFAGDGGPATAARLDFPYGVRLDAAGNIYIGDNGNRRIRKVDTSGVITTFAGTGVSGFSGDGGPAIAAQLSDAFGLEADGTGNVYVADVFNNRIRKIDASGIISTFAGSGPAGNTQGGFSGDGGPANLAQLNGPTDIALDRAGNFYVADGLLNKRIRKIGTASVPPVPVVSISSRKIHGSAGPFDINLPLTGTPGVECRRGGANGNHQVVFTFAKPVTVNGTPDKARVSSGSGTVSNVTVTGAEVTVDLTGVTNAQKIVLTLFGVNDGTNTNDVSVPMNVLLGDTNADGTVNSGDAQQTRNLSGQLTEAANFRSDVNTDGTVNSGDAFIVRSKSGTGINP